MGDDQPDRTFSHTDRTLDYAHVRDSALLGMRNVFVRLAPPGTATPANTFDAVCVVDVDADGDVIGITLSWEEHPPPTWLPEARATPDDLGGPTSDLREYIPRIKCPRCGAISYHAKDIEQGWCSQCHAVTSQPSADISGTPEGARLMLSNLRGWETIWRQRFGDEDYERALQYWETRFVAIEEGERAPWAD